MIDLNELFEKTVGNVSDPGFDPHKTVPQFYRKARELTMDREDWLALDEYVWAMMFDHNCGDRDVLTFLDKKSMSSALWKKLLHFRPEFADDHEFDPEIFDVEEAIDEIRFNPVQAQYYDLEKLFPPEKRSPYMFRGWDTEEIIDLAYHSRDRLADYLLENRIKLKDRHLKDLAPEYWGKLIWCDVDFLFHKYFPLDETDDIFLDWDDVAESFAVKHPDWREINVRESVWKKIETFCPDIRKSLKEQSADRGDD